MNRPLPPFTVVAGLDPALATPQMNVMPSSVIASHRYEPATGELTIVFTSGRTYVYRDVPTDVAAAFDISLSKGIFFNARIRDEYRYREVTGAPE